MGYRVTIGGSVEKPEPKVSGEVVQDASWSEVEKRFGVSLDQMKQRIRDTWRLSSGGPAPHPKRVLLTDSSGWPWKHGSYRKYHLTPVQMKQRALRARIVKETSEPYAVVADRWENHSSREAEYGGALSYALSRSITSGWSQSVSVGISSTVSVEVGGEAVGGKVGASTTLSLETSIGEHGSKSEESTVSIDRRLSTTLPPMTAAEARLTATRGRLIIEVEYELSLSGHLWIDFGRRVRLSTAKSGHYFYFARAGMFGLLNAPKRFRQNIDIEYYHGAQLSLVDALIEPTRGGNPSKAAS